MHGELIQSTLLLLLLVVCAVYLLRRLHLPAILGYLFIGILTGPFALNWIHADEVIHLLGEMGVVFLLFTIGLEFSIPVFIRLRSSLLGLGGTQVLIGTLSGMVIAMMIGFDWRASLIMGGALSLSSTAIVIKQLVDQQELQKTHGRLAISILLFQDLAAIPFLLMIPIFAAEQSGGYGTVLMYAALKAFIAFSLLLLAGRWLLRPLFQVVAASKSVELFTLSVLLVAITAAWFTDLLGLSLALGAFIAGMTLGETQFRHQIEAEIRPFRDVLLGIFFITVGMQLNLTEVLHLWPWVTLLVCGLMVGKGLFITIMTRLTGYPISTAISTGMILGQGGEFGIALLSLSLSTGLISSLELQPVLAAIIISMAIAPVLIRLHSELGARFQPLPEGNKGDDNTEVSSAHHEQHIIICGYGRTGKTISRIFDEQNIPYLIIENDLDTVTDARNEQPELFYGDAMDVKILESLGLSSARAVLISFDHIESARTIVSHISQYYPEIPVIARAHDQTDLEILENAGATAVVPEHLETSLMLVTQLFLAIGISSDDVMAYLESIKQDHYKPVKNI